jgi:predicted nucleic acid-binding protein
MTFAQLAAGDAVFVDANTLLYHCTVDPVFGSACTNILDRQAVDDLCIGKLQILSISPAMVPMITAISQQIGLLTNDAAVVAHMQSSGLSKIASNDPDFDRVPGISRYAPV